MKLIEHRLSDFVREVASPSPAPGGGSVAAAAAAMGAGLVRMMGHLTVGKKKFLALGPDVQDAFRTVTEKMDGIQACLLDLVDEDTLAFNRIMEAYALPKTTEEEIAVRTEAVRKATIGAIRVPLETASLALDVLVHLDIVLEHGNRNCLSDLAVGALMLYAGLEGALLNVETNLSSIDDAERAEGFRKKCEEFLETGRTAKDRILSTVHACLRG